MDFRCRIKDKKVTKSECVVCFNANEGNNNRGLVAVKFIGNCRRQGIEETDNQCFL